MIKNVRHFINYMPWSVLHPIQYFGSERLRKATNLVGDCALDCVEDKEPFSIWMPYEGKNQENDGWVMKVCMEYDPLTPEEAAELDELFG